MNRRNFIKFISLGASYFFLPKLETEERKKTYDVFSTGLPAIDDAMDGGFHPGELILIIGEAASGKTGFVNSINKANNIKVKHNDEEYNLQTINIFGEGIGFSDIMERDPLKMDWQSRIALAQKYRQESFRYSEAYLWTINIQRQPPSICHQSEGFSLLYLADYVFHLKHGYVYLSKNRYGSRAECEVEYVFENNKILTRQK